MKVRICSCVWGGCDARLGSRRCGRVERRTASEALGRVVRHGIGLYAQVCDEVRLRRSVKVRIQSKGKAEMSTNRVSQFEADQVRVAARRLGRRSKSAGRWAAHGLTGMPGAERFEDESNDR